MFRDVFTVFIKTWRPNLKPRPSNQASSFRSTIVQYYDKIFTIYIYFNQSQDSRPAEIQSCDVIGWKKYRWSKFCRTIVQWCYLVRWSWLLIEPSYFDKNSKIIPRHTRNMMYLHIRAVEKKIGGRVGFPKSDIIK